MRKKILIIDDNTDLRTVVRNYLKKHDRNLDIFEATTAEMGVAKASCISPHIVLMDFNLPNANGLEATKQIKLDNPQCDVIMLTMFEVKALEQKAYGMGVVDFIGKSEIHDRLMPSIIKCFDKMVHLRKGIPL
jgi:two-component system response regulator YesN